MGKGQTAGANAYLQKQIDAINVSLTDVVIPLLLSDWTDNGDGTYIQTVAVNGLSGDSNPTIQLSPVGDVASADENDSLACISGVKTTDGNMTFIANELPKISFTVIAKGVIAGVNDVTADITALVGRVSELEKTEILYEANTFKIKKSGNVIDIIFVQQTCDESGYVDIGDSLKDYVPAKVWGETCAYSYDCLYGTSGTQGMLCLRADGKLRIMTKAGSSLTTSQQYCSGKLTYVV